jgi:hypothetical protein
MLDRALPINDATERLCATDVARVVSIAAICAGKLAVDRHKHASIIRQAADYAPGTPLLSRSPDAALDPDQSRGLVDFAARFVEVLAKLSPAAEIMNRGSYLPLRPGSITIPGKYALWRSELNVSVTTNRGIVERSDVAWVARLLLEEAAFRLDKVVLSSATKDVRGLLHRIAPVSASLATEAMERDVDNLKARLGPYAAGAVFIAAPAQAKVLDGYRRYAKAMSNTVR